MTTLRPELLDELLADYETPEDLLGDEGLFKQLKKVLLERALGAELTDHLGYEKGDPAGRGSGNSRNGHSGKTVLTEDGEVDLEVPRDRNGSFEPAIVPKGERRLDGFDDRILSLYARGMTVREIQGHLHELYRVEVSPDLISRVTDAVLEEVREWQNRPLDAVYPVVFFDALRVKIRDEGLVRNKAVYLALGITCQGEKEVLGLWIEQTEGAKFWLKVMNELRTRGVGDVLIAVVDGLTGFPDAIATVFPQTAVHTCIVGLLKKPSLCDSVPQYLVFELRRSRDVGSQGPRSAGAVHHGLIARTVPEDHVLARVDRVLDLGWLRETVSDCYCADNGRPGIDPEAAVRLMLAGFLLGIVHDRKLLREAQVNLAIRWFAGYRLHERLPDHSSLTRIRQRWGERRFREIFERTVACCVDAGIATGEVVHIDATLIRANASWNGMVERHTTAVLDGNASAPVSKRPDGGKRVSLTDPDATLARAHRRGRVRPSYKQHTAVDDQAGVIVDLALTTGSTNEGDLVEAHLDNIPRLTGRPIDVLTADSGYAYAKTYRSAERRGVDPVIPPKAEPPPKSRVPLRRFRYDARHDIVRCPAGKTMRRSARAPHGWFFRARVADCRSCALRGECLPRPHGARAVVISDGYDALLRARRRRPRWTALEERHYRRHRWRAEGIFAEAKVQHGLWRGAPRPMERRDSGLPDGDGDQPQAARRITVAACSDGAVGPPPPRRIGSVTGAERQHGPRWTSRPQPLAMASEPPQTGFFNSPIVHLIRNSLTFVSWKDRKKVMPDLKAIYRAETAEAAATRLEEFEAAWGSSYPAVAPAWRRAWEHVVPMFAFPPAIRKLIYTTNALESLHRSLRKIIKTRGSFPSDEAATKLLYLAIRNAGMRWKRPVDWTAAMGQFAILFEDRFPASAS